MHRLNLECRMRSDIRQETDSLSGRFLCFEPWHVMVVIANQRAVAVIDVALFAGRALDDHPIVSRYGSQALDAGLRPAAVGNATAEPSNSAPKSVITSLAGFGEGGSGLVCS